MKEHGSWSLLLTSLFCNIGATLSNIPHMISVFLWVAAGISTILALFNQWYTFRKNYKTLWIVVKVNYVFTAILPKKKRHRGITITKKKPE